MNVSRKNETLICASKKCLNISAPCIGANVINNIEITLIGYEFSCRFEITIRLLYFSIALVQFVYGMSPVQAFYILFSVTRCLDYFNFFGHLHQ